MSERRGTAKRSSAARKAKPAARKAKPAARKVKARRPATAARKTTVRKPVARKPTVRKPVARKAASKSPARTPARKAARRTSTRASSTARRTSSTARRTSTRASSTTRRAPARRPVETAPRRTTEAIQSALLDVEQEEFAAVAATVAGEPAPPSIAIAGVTPGSLGIEQVEEALPPQEFEFADRREDVPIAIAGAVLAGSVFLPWYKVGTAAQQATGWETGTWGPLIFFIGVAAVALVVLRKLRVHVNLPFAESMVLEGFGWLATLTAILKARFRPSLAGLQMQTVPWVYLAVAAGIVLALLAGRVSGKAPLMAMPGWHKGRAGKIGAALLLVVIGAGGTFGWVLNSYSVASGTRGPSFTPTGGGPAPTVVKGLPACAKDYPIPDDFTPFNGIESKNAQATCVATYQTTRSTAETATLLEASLRTGGWTFTRQQTGQATTLQVTKPRCGSITVIPSTNKQVYVVVNVSNCVAK